MSSSPAFHLGRQPHLDSAWQFPHPTRPPLPKRPHLTHHPQRTTFSIWETILPHGPTKTQTGDVYSLLIRNRRRKRSIRTTHPHCASYLHVSTRVPRSSPSTSQSSKSVVSRYVHKRKDAKLRWIISQETFWSPQSPYGPNLREPYFQFLVCV
jgi:hypothetical protein